MHHESQKIGPSKLKTTSWNSLGTDAVQRPESSFKSRLAVWFYGHCLYQIIRKFKMYRTNNLYS